MSIAARKLDTADLREAELIAAIYHVLRYGKIGKQSRARLKAAVKASIDGRTQ